ncbi:MAG TPA: hypothetical protein VN700_13475 [Vicinamibacterales bacterium]|nr:hypothetical protein [Vicinamibacterales bacterium]
MQTISARTRRFSLRRSLTFAFIAAITASPAWSQGRITPPSETIPPRATKEVNLSGPRFGLTLLSPGNMDALKDKDIMIQRPLVSQFGWQFEKRLYTTDEGVTTLTEFVPLISGLEQGVALPSLNWLVGVRTPSGTEFGIGPNITPVGIGLVVTGGITVRSGALNIPLNFAVASSKSGARVSIMTGFNLRR